ncbi:MAG: ferritin family protein [Bacteroidetes bacterium]|nr:ferritin family protein [Bacteroidota bacterium]MBT3749099.1 ferritin family protein [Bacteroidota bacterium]MBT4399747.1 ferritin family protein [Bacteroidota bacterium]MBT4410385.1 ferritin family protein [Bacteroidota bacterium]MBT5428131.1 ferritin family protein [Bacteroidota bacterium]
MKEFKNINEILDFAMASEQRAIDLYSNLAEKSGIQEMRDTFISFAKEEMKHKAQLVKIKREGFFEHGSEKVTDMKIADYTADVKPTENMLYHEALILAMSQEKAAFKLYSTLADRAPNQDLKNLFLSLAQEEAKHKLRFEIEYDEYVLRDN